MAKAGTTVARGNQMKSMSKGAVHGPAVKNVQSSAKSKGIMGSGMSHGKMSPIKGSSKGGL